MKTDMPVVMVEMVLESMFKKTNELENKIEDHWEEESVLYRFIMNQPISKIEEFVKFMYVECPKKAKYYIGHLHDDCVDLSTIECSKKDFKPW